MNRQQNGEAATQQTRFLEKWISTLRSSAESSNESTYLDLWRTLPPEMFDESCLPLMEEMAEIRDTMNLKDPVPYMKSAAIHMQLKQPHSALAMLFKVLSLPSLSPLPYNMTLEALLMSGDTASARDFLERTLLVLPESTDRRELYRSWLSVNPSSTDMLEGFLATFGGSERNIAERLDEARILEGERLYEEALKVYYEALKADPADTSLEKKIEVLHSRVLDERVKDAKKKLSRVSDNEQIIKRLEDIAAPGEKTPEASGYLENAVELEKLVDKLLDKTANHDLETVSDLAVALMQLERHRDAAGLIENALSRGNKEETVTVISAAPSSSEQAEVEKARYLLCLALQMASEHLGCIEKASVFLNDGDPGQDHYLALKYLLATSLTAIGKIDLAALHYRHILDRDPGYRDSRSKLADLDRFGGGS